MLRNLRESEERFRSLVTQAADAFYLIDQDGRILDVNQSACDYLGYTREGLLELNIADVDVEIEDRRHKERFWDSLRPGEAATFEGVHRSKGRFHVSSRSPSGCAGAGRAPASCLVWRAISLREENPSRSVKLTFASSSAWIALTKRC